MYPQTSSFYGYCDCNCEQYSGKHVNIPQSYCVGETKDGHKRILAFEKKSADACQILFEQVGIFNYSDD
jgi:hypothetical protein